MRVGIVLKAVMAIVAHGFMRRKGFEPIVVILDEALLIVVNVNAGGNVHGVDKAQAFGSAAFFQSLFHLRRDVDVIAARRRLEFKGLPV
jgi:hypothetical protein